MSPRPPEDDPRNDLELVEAINAGEHAAFEALYRRYQDWVVQLARRFGRDESGAWDVLQETFVYVLGKFPGFELTARFTTFLYPVVRHIAIAHRKKGSRHVLTGETIEPNTTAAAPAEDQRQQLAALMKSLPDGQREALLLRYVDGLSLEEIAQALEIPTGTVKSRIHNALGAMKKDPNVKNYFEM